MTYHERRVKNHISCRILLSYNTEASMYSQFLDYCQEQEQNDACNNKQVQHI